MAKRLEALGFRETKGYRRRPVRILACREVAMGQNQWDPILVGEFTTHFRTYFCGWVESDVWGLTDLDFDPREGNWNWGRPPDPKPERSRSGTASGLRGL